MPRMMLLCGLLLLAGCGERVATPESSKAQVLSDRVGAAVIAQKKWGGSDVTFFFPKTTPDEAIAKMLEATAGAKPTEARHAETPPSA